MVKIISDSTCDLSQELLDKYEISILPLHILLGDTECEDGINITPDEIYNWSEEHKMTPKTSAPAMDRAVDLLQPYVEKRQEVICFAISGEMSTSANVFRLAASDLEAEETVFVINSENLSTGIGLLVIEAAIMANKGKSAKEIVEYIERLRPFVRASFVVDTLTYLHRGGRCSGLAAMAGGVLKLHPKIVVENGKMLPKNKYRGKMNKVLLEYVKEMEMDLRHAKKERVFITHSGCDAETSLIFATLITVMFMLVLYLPRKVITFKGFMDSFVEGFKMMIPAIAILIFAWSLKGMGDALEISTFVKNIVGSNTSASVILPAILFLVAIFLSFSTGTSWGTFAILVPIAIAMFPGADDMQMMIIAVSAVLSGAVCGDHISLIQRLCPQQVHRVIISTM